jgi:rhamnose transport system permease protein
VLERMRSAVRWEVGLVFALVAVVLFGVAESSQFLTSVNFFFLNLSIGEVAIMALPMTLIIVTGEIDLSVASVVGLSSVLVGVLHHDAGLSIPVAGLVALLVGVVCGLFNGFLVAYVGLPSLAVTIGTLALYRGLAVGLLGTTAVTDFPLTWTNLAQGGFANGRVPYVVVPIVALVVVFGVLLHFTSFGRGLYDIGLNSEAAHFTGVNVARTKLVTFVLTGAVSALAGIDYTLRYGSARGDNATGLELQVIAAVLLGGVSIFGGRGALPGVLGGVLLIGVLSSALRLENVTVNVINVIIGLLLVLSVVSPRFLTWLTAVGRRVRTGRDQVGPRSRRVTA